jgi:hypothetical protein
MLVVVDEDDELFASGALCFTVEGGRRAMVSWLAGGSAIGKCRRDVQEV